MIKKLSNGGMQEGMHEQRQCQILQQDTELEVFLYFSLFSETNIKNTDFAPIQVFKTLPKYMCNTERVRAAGGPQDYVITHQQAETYCGCMGLTIHKERHLGLDPNTCQQSI